MNPIKTPIHLVAVVVGLISAVLVYCAPNQMTKADSGGCLLAAQQLVSEGHLYLDDYPDLANPEDYRFQIIGDHVHYALGFGVAVLCAPTVWLANQAGLDMTDSGDEALVQRVVAALVVGGVMLLCYFIGGLMLAPPIALAYAVVFTFGTSLSSTLGTALWNQDFEVLALLGSVYFVVERTVLKKDLRALELGLALGLAAFCRPTALLAGALGFAFVLVSDRRKLLLYLAGIGFWALSLLVISKWVYGMWIPPYYQAVTQDWTWRPDIVLFGLLASPGRGIFVFSPFLVFVVIWPLFRRPQRHELFLALGGIVWFLLHVVLLARHFHWWGGHCFGPRLLTDAVPALVLTGVVVLADLVRKARAGSGRLALGVFMTLAAVSMGVHAYSGLYNPWTQVWNSRPNIDPNVHYIFDWRFPQALASEKQILARQIDAVVPALPDLACGTPASSESPGLGLVGWMCAPAPEGGTACCRVEHQSAAVVLALAPNHASGLSLDLHLELEESQKVRVSWNDVPLGVLAAATSLPIPADALLAARDHRPSSIVRLLIPAPLRRPYGPSGVHEVKVRLMDQAAGATFCGLTLHETRRDQD